MYKQTTAARLRMSRWERMLLGAAAEAREGDAPEKIEWFKRGIARRRKELFSMDFAETE